MVDAERLSSNEEGRSVRGRQQETSSNGLYDPLMDEDGIGDRVGGEGEIETSKSSQYFGAIFNLANTALGAGILSMPYAFEESGLALGIIIIVTIVVLCALSQDIVVLGVLECRKLETRGARRVTSYDSMIRSLLGPAWGTTMEILIALYQFGACVAYVLVFEDQLSPLIKCGSCGGDWCKIRPADKVPDDIETCDGFWTQRYVVILLSSWCLMFPPSILHDVSMLKYVSLLGVVCPFIMCTIVSYFGIDDMVRNGAGADFEHISYFTHSADGVFVAIPIFCFALQSHISVPVIFNGYSKVQRKSDFQLVIAAAYLIVTMLYIPCGLFGLSYFTENALDTFPRDVLTGFKTNATLANVARVCMAGAAVCCYPLNHIPARCAIFNVVKTFTGVDVDKHARKNIFYLIEIVVFTVFASGLAILVPDVAKVFGVLGATVASCSMFVFPGLIMYHFATTYSFEIGSPSLSGASPRLSPLVRKSSWLKRPKQCSWSVVIGLSYAFFGIAIAIIGTYASLK